MSVGVQPHRSRFPFSLFNPRCHLSCTGRHATTSETESDISMDGLLSQCGSCEYADTEISSLSDGSYRSRLSIFNTPTAVTLGEAQGETSTEGVTSSNKSIRVRSLDELEFEWYGKHAKLCDAATVDSRAESSNDGSLAQATNQSIDMLASSSVSRASTISACLSDLSDFVLEEQSSRPNYLDGNYVFNFERQCEFNASIARILAPWTSSHRSLDDNQSISSQSEPNQSITTETNDQVVPNRPRGEEIEVGLDSLFHQLDNQSEQQNLCAAAMADDDVKKCDNNEGNQTEICDDEENEQLRDTNVNATLIVDTFVHEVLSDNACGVGTSTLAPLGSVIQESEELIPSSTTNEGSSTTNETPSTTNETSSTTNEGSSATNEASTTTNERSPEPEYENAEMLASSITNETSTEPVYENAPTVDYSQITAAITANINDFIEQLTVPNPDTMDDCIRSNTNSLSLTSCSQANSNLSTPSRISLCSTLFSMDSTSLDDDDDNQVTTTEAMRPLFQGSSIPLFNRPALPASSHFQTNMQQQAHRNRRRRGAVEPSATEQRFESIFAEIPPLSDSQQSSPAQQHSGRSPTTSSTPESRTSTMDSRSSAGSNNSNDATGTIQQQWYIYDPRLVNEARTQRIEMATRHRGQTNAWSMPGIVQPPSYDEVNDNTPDDVDEVPPPYEHGENGDVEISISPTEYPTEPPPSYDQSLNHRLYEDNTAGHVNEPSANIDIPQPHESDTQLSSSMPGAGVGMSANSGLPLHPCSYPPPSYRLTGTEERPSMEGLWDSTPSDQEIEGVNDQSADNTDAMEHVTDGNDMDNVDIDIDLELDDDIIDQGEMPTDLQGRQLSHTLRRYPVGSMMGQRPVLRWTGAVSGRRINTTQNWFL